MADFANTRNTDLMENQLESQLLSSLNPVSPNPEFVTRLRGRLERRPAIVLEKRSFLEAYLVVALGLFGGVFLIWLFYGLISWISKDINRSAAPK